MRDAVTAVKKNNYCVCGTCGSGLSTTMLSNNISVFLFLLFTGRFLPMTFIIVASFLFVCFSFHPLDKIEPKFFKVTVEVLGNLLVALSTSCDPATLSCVF